MVRKLTPVPYINTFSLYKCAKILKFDNSTENHKVSASMQIQNQIWKIGDIATIKIKVRNQTEFKIHTTSLKIRQFFNFAVKEQKEVKIQLFEDELPQLKGKYEEKSFLIKIPIKFDGLQAPTFTGRLATSQIFVKLELEFSINKIKLEQEVIIMDESATHRLCDFQGQQQQPYVEEILE